MRAIQWNSKPDAPILEDLPSIIEIHKSCFDGFFLTRMGAPFLRAYYGIVADYSGGILLVTEHGGQPVGFVAGFVDPARFYASLSAHKVQLLWPTLRGLLCDPRLFPLVLANRRRVGQIFEAGSPRWVVESELSSIAVHPLVQGKGGGPRTRSGFPGSFRSERSAIGPPYDGCHGQWSDPRVLFGVGLPSSRGHLRSGRTAHGRIRAAVMLLPAGGTRNAHPGPAQ